MKLKSDPELLRRLKESAKAVKKMSPKEYNKMIEAQRQSWARQDMD